MINILIPMGGTGKPFAERGYTFPKPLVEIQGRPMIEVVVGNLTPHEPHRFIFVCHSAHLQQYAMADLFRLIAPDSVVVPMPGPTAGALCSALLAKDYIDNADELIVANADQFIDSRIGDFLDFTRREGTDGCLITFPARHPKWSFAKVDKQGRVLMTAEKRPISNQATAGIYYFRTGALFVAAAERLIMKGARSSGEFYTCPVYNELILDGCTVTIYPIAKHLMHSLGTPEDVEAFAKTFDLDAALEGR